ncbi:MAG: bifunctional aminodeoxychorismate synthase component I/aminotransferase [Actinobacteria bacterium HGW-Actinobacteria-2]|nr:MAG: bifunctional aminodeoxychorismate synthase component I/aminotransferase [Actinobacteria bacterium HGW-Actinobacteria-2]
MTTVYAAFDFPAAPPERRDRIRGIFTAPGRLLQARTVEEVPAIVEAAEAAARAGHWVIGGLRYHAGAWDRAQKAHNPSVPALFEVFDEAPQDWPTSTCPAPALDWRASHEAASAAAAINTVLERIRSGACYQVNLTQRWRAVRPLDWSLFDYFSALHVAQPGGYGLCWSAGGVASISPELFFHREGDHLVTEPMKGTASADADPEVLRTSAKDRAENLMIVDLLRNDLSRICRPGTVRVDRLFELQRLPTVWQLTSTVVGDVAAATSLADIFAALFPCGSVTGAPKIAAMAVIAELEDSPRGWYCGALGVIRPGGTATFNVPIRTVEAHETQLVCGIGSGIVADSRPEAELAEWELKTRFLGGRPVRALETMRIEDGQVGFIEDHLARLQRTCAAWGLELDPAAVRARLEAACPATGAHRLRLVAGDGEPLIEVTSAPQLNQPVRLRLAREPLDLTWLAPVITHKTTHRAHYDRLRAQGGADVFDVICHARGLLTEATIGNLAVRLDGRWYTPRDEGNLLNGVRRARLVADGTLIERRLPLHALDDADEVAFISTLRGWCPATVVR